MTQPKILTKTYQAPSLSQLDGVPRPPVTPSVPQAPSIIDLRSGSGVYNIQGGAANWARITCGGGGGGTAAATGGAGGGGCCQSPWIYLGGYGMRVAYSVGSGGAIGNNAGGNTTASFAPPTGAAYNMQANGGGYGVGAGGAGGTASGGAVNYTGGNGGTGSGSVGGGGAAGTTGNGGNGGSTSSGNGSSGTGNGGGGGAALAAGGYPCGGGGIGCAGSALSTGAGLPGSSAPWGTTSGTVNGGDWGGGAGSSNSGGTGGNGGVRIELC